MEAKRSLYGDRSPQIHSGLEGFSLPGWIYRDADFLEAEKGTRIRHVVAGHVPPQ
jgi:hypothetical protein